MAGIGWRHPHYGELLERSGELHRGGLDFLEVHSENFFADGGAALAVLMQGRETFPVSLHGVGLALGSACGIDTWHLDQLDRLVRRIEPVRVSDHACFARVMLGDAEVHAADLLPIPFNDESLQVLAANVEQVQERLKRPIAVENLSAYVSWRLSGDALAETQFLNQLATQTGCQLLIDVNNIYVNALNQQRSQRPDLALTGHEQLALVSCRAWIDAIAPQHVAEIHLAGHHVGSDLVIDDHGSLICPSVWALYRHAVARFGAVATLIEWDTDIPPLAVLLSQAGQADRIALQQGEPYLVAA